MREMNNIIIGNLNYRRNRGIYLKLLLVKECVNEKESDQLKVIVL